MRQHFPKEEITPTTKKNPFTLIAKGFHLINYKNLSVYGAEHFLSESVGCITLRHSILNHLLNFYRSAKIGDEFAYDVHFLIRYTVVFTIRFQNFNAALYIGCGIVSLQMSNYRQLHRQVLLKVQIYLSVLGSQILHL